MQLRTQAVLAATALSLVLLGAACGGNEEPANSGVTIATASPNAAAAGASLPNPAVTAALSVPGAGVSLPSPVAAAATAAAGAGAGLPTGATVPSGASGADATFNNFKAQFASLKSYRITTVMESGAQRTEMTVDVQLPDRYKATISAGTIPVETIGIGNQTYIKVGPFWQVAPGATSMPFTPAQLALTVEGLMNAPNVVKGAASSVGGSPCTVYTVTSPPAQKADICIGADSLPRQVKYFDGASTVTITYSMFNASFNITAPI
jgi:outer membrane lipoprotein-sorting protein